MADWNAISAFLAHVVPWPGSAQDPGHIAWINTFVDRRTATGRNAKGRFPVGNGKIFHSVDALVSYIGWANGTDSIKDQYFCLSRQKNTKMSRGKNAHLVPDRSGAGAVALKAIWLDVDYGKEDSYATLQEALKEVLAFTAKVSLPPPSALVSTGGGVHAYWISKEPLTPKDWKPYAEGLKALAIQEGLKADHNVTADSARILRLPGSLNHKLEQPRPCELLAQPLRLFDFATDLQLLPSITPVGQPYVEPPKTVELFAEGANLDSFKNPPIIIADPADSLGSGIDKLSGMLVDPQPIFKDCAFYRNAFANGGKDYDQALWMYSILGTTFMENGRVFAHQISKGHKDYAPADTDEMYDRKLGERARLGLGYPSCAAIAGAGSKACQTCPLRSKGRSPLNIRPAPKAVTATVSATQSPDAVNLKLPWGYDVDNEGHICKVLEVRDKEGNTDIKYLKLFLTMMKDPWCEGDPNDGIHVTALYYKGRWVPAFLRWKDFGALDFGRLLTLQKIKICPDNKKYLEQFLVSWLAKLHAEAAAQSSLPFGWYKESGQVRGFVYGGQLMKDDGSEQPCGAGDGEIRKVFHPSGDAKDWFEAEKLLNGLLRPELSAIVALSFAAPLMALLGKSGGTLCAYGESGAGKSAAFSVGVSVWGHSKLGKAVTHSTFNGVMRKMGELSNLPFYWDEIKDKKAQAAVYDYIYAAVDGVEKDRLNSDSTSKKRGIWQTAMCMAANISFTDYVIAQDPSHVAGVSRVLEYGPVQKRDSGPGWISQTDAEVVYNRLMDSYGHMGLLYGKYLALNHVAVAKQVIDVCKRVEIDMQNTAEERFWVALVGSLIVGADIANKLGCHFDVEALQAFLYKVYRDNRAKRDEMLVMGTSKDRLENIMTDYFEYVRVHDQMLWTHGMPVGPGKPAATTILAGPKETKNVSVDAAVVVRWDCASRTLLIKRDHFVKFLNERGVGTGTVMQRLKSEYKMEIRQKVRIGAGVFDLGRSTVCAIEKIGPKHDFAELMYKYSKPDETAQTATDVGLQNGV